MAEAADDLHRALERITALERRVAELERRLAPADPACPDCGAVIEVLVLRMHPNFPDLKEAWVRCPDRACGYAGWRAQPPVSMLVGGTRPAGVSGGRASEGRVHVRVGRLDELQERPTPPVLDQGIGDQKVEPARPSRAPASQARTDRADTSLRCSPPSRRSNRREADAT